MEIDLRRIEAEVSKAVTRILGDRKATNDVVSEARREGFGYGPRFGYANAVGELVDDNAIGKFLRPYVSRAYNRRAVADIKKIVSVSLPLEDRSTGTMTRACLVESKRYPGIDRALQRMSSSYFASTFAIDKDRVAILRRFDKTYFTTEDNLRKFDMEVDFTKRAGKLGVGPAVLDAFACMADAHGRVHGIIVTTRIDGAVSLDEWIHKDGRTTADRAALSIKLGKLISKMHKASIYHHGLYPSSVVVDGKGTPYITNFQNATASPVKKEIEVASPGHDVNGIHADFEVVSLLDDKNTESFGGKTMHKAFINALSSAVARDLVEKGALVVKR